MGAFSTLTALAIIGVASALDIWWMLASVLGGGTLGLFLLGLFVKRANGRAAAVATVLNFVVIVWMAISLSPRLSWLLPESLLYTGNSNLPIVFGTLLLLISGIVLSFFAPFRRDPVEADVVPAIEPSVAAST
jgi:SSS family solute:Na+ symporter